MNNLKPKPKSSLLSRQRNMRFGEASFELLSDFLNTLNNQNKSNVKNVSCVCGKFKDRRVAGGSLGIYCTLCF